MRRCEICGKKSRLAVVRKLLRGKYNPTTKTRKYPNLQWLTLPGGRVRACTQCMRSHAKREAARATL